MNPARSNKNGLIKRAPEKRSPLKYTFTNSKKSSLSKGKQKTKLFIKGKYSSKLNPL